VKCWSSVCKPLAVVCRTRAAGVSGCCRRIIEYHQSTASSLSASSSSSSLSSSAAAAAVTGWLHYAHPIISVCRYISGCQEMYKNLQKIVEFSGKLCFVPIYNFAFTDTMCQIYWPIFVNSQVHCGFCGTQFFWSPWPLPISPTALSLFVVSWCKKRSENA